MKYLKVEQLENKNQFVIFTGEETYFQSYSSVVAMVKNGVLTLGKDWDYSHTTLKPLYLFLDNIVYVKEWANEIKYSNNKRQTIQKLINEKKIKFNKNL